MKRMNAVKTAVVAGCALIATAAMLSPSTAWAQERDEDWVVAQVLSGNLDELRSLKAQSDRGVPFAMYWWGQLLENCVFDRCDQVEARKLYMRAAVAGHGRAKAMLFATPQSRAELNDMAARVGIPTGGIERIAYLGQLASIDYGSRLSETLGTTPDSEATTEQAPPSHDERVAMLVGERQLGILILLVGLDGHLRRGEELRAITNSGFPGLSDKVRAHDFITGIVEPRASWEETIERARTGGLGVGAAYCDSALTSGGPTVLPAALLEVCERAARAGFPGAVRALIFHHHFSGNTRAADYFVGLCDALIGILCAGVINEYHVSQQMKGADLPAGAALWDLAATNMSVVELLDSGLLSKQEQEKLLAPPGDLRRALFVLRVRTQIIAEACFTTQLDPSGEAIAANPRCPWLKPIDIPAEFTDGAR